MQELYYKTASELSELLDKKELSAVELTKTVIERTKAVEDRVAAFNSYDEADALKQAEASDLRRAGGKTLGPLDGIPVGIKDVLAVKDQPLTCSSKMLENFVSPYDATCIQKLRSNGAVLWGRLNMDEYAMGSSTENSAFKKTSNPWNLDCVPGGSSGGSAAALAAGEAPLTLGSDTGGSIRQPASYCGVVGLKPTYGRVSRFGLAAFASSLDQVGPMARSVKDAAMLLQGIAGHDERDSTSYRADVPDYLAAMESLKGKKWTLGLPKEYFENVSDESAMKPVQDAIEFYRSLGCEIKEVSLPHTEYAVATYYIIATAEASSNLARYDGIRYTHRAEAFDAKDSVDIYCQSRAEGFGEEVKRRVILGTYVLSSGYYDAYYLKAQKVRTLIRRDFENAFKEVDAILAPTSPSTAFKKGEKTADPLSMYLSDIYTISANLAGIAGLSLPCGYSDGLPVGLQVLGKPFKEEEILAVAQAFESAHDFKNQHPNL
ncbi:Asp-tRNA(Asn)/Glu-tRNA(Gln) amidotransferase subunit GatA [Pelagicoccus sp. SDUM812003]|uniref:Asp-tRNA(Asn)/Glu-tRNA(Gln) amidotransferase subunit GatA n=1 Tax=Pelagicoccus sp. SDUM812003 TaxID=3041267 RepID=UPI00280F082B|nr:Asp-tRNA(Asn)/Glu-tRNA(Gln) amidotransferase subunit GatA [Pelagicoccus sp. SDUM812003]MDQ8203677.1 Asp-tRNA(Asn)/Glu-tRNA(Gln) amidotransferase subunit GatA [Pelagicoccus sp. SDUM812003]